MDAAKHHTHAPREDVASLNIHLRRYAVPACPALRMAKEGEREFDSGRKQERTASAVMLTSCARVLGDNASVGTCSAACQPLRTPLFLVLVAVNASSRGS